ncbi:ionotropic receptor 25a [Halyomorpha halys]|uniref:ionotropic receptor 25a n=1 Tax=Halyomorpha halys TaxID=286706 RepID=UPI0006D4CC17|nr:glutamate receptor 2 [Halyomorpha halys]KAE8573466.1 Ionotropic receptor 114 [Halyomorpha halys]
MLASLMNITWKVLIIDDKWGLKFPNGTWSAGIFKTLLEGQADIAMGSIWLTIEKYESVPLSTDVGFLSLQNLIRRPVPSNAVWSSFFQHYPLSLWILLLLAAVINFLGVFFISYFTKTIKSDTKYKKWSAISDCSMMTFGAISVDTNHSSDKNPGPVRYLITCWAITTFILMTNFGSSLISYLTTPELRHRPENIQGLVEGGYFWGLTYVPDFERIFDLSNPWHKKWIKKFKLIKNKEEHMRLITNDKFVLWGKALQKKYFVMIEDYWRSDLLSEYEMSSETLATFYTTMALTPGSQLLPAINKYSRRLIETGHLKEYINRALTIEGDPYMSEVVLKTKKGTIGYTTLKISQFQGVFYFLFVGLSIATISFFSEIVYYRNTKK